jgi:hypothetical protein
VPAIPGASFSGTRFSRTGFFLEQLFWKLHFSRTILGTVTKFRGRLA